MASNYEFQKTIDSLLNTLDDEETDIDKITNVTHNVLMAISLKTAVNIVEEKEKNGENLNSDEKAKMIGDFTEITYSEELDFIKKSFLNLDLNKK